MSEEKKTSPLLTGIRWLRRERQIQAPRSATPTRTRSQNAEEALIRHPPTVGRMWIAIGATCFSTSAIRDARGKRGVAGQRSFGAVQRAGSVTATRSESA
jgi:hypothetical protein